jgi:hypothetical protein
MNEWADLGDAVIDKDQLGGHSQDLRDLRIPLPAENTLKPEDQDSRARRFGARAFSFGIAIMVGGLIAALVCAVAGDNNLFHKPPATLFAMLSLICIEAIGAVLIQVGAHERLARPDRAMNRKMLAQQQQNASRVMAQVRENAKDLEELRGFVSPLPRRLENLEKVVNAMEHVVNAVPDYSQGLADGARIISGATDGKS